MRIVQQLLAEQEMITTLGTNLHMMSGKVTNKATTSDKEQVSPSLSDKQESVSKVKQFTATNMGAEKRDCL
jgi:hypothetical protein